MTCLPADRLSIVDIGDADIIHTGGAKSHDNIPAAVPAPGAAAAGAGARPP